MGICWYKPTPLPKSILPNAQSDLRTARVGNFDPSRAVAFPRRSWEPDIVGLVIMADFAAKDWRAATTIAPPPAFDSVQTREEVDYLIELAETTRPGRMDEIVEQDFGFHEFLLRVAMMTERSHPATFDLAKSAARVGEMLMSHYKWMYKRPRPQQLAPVLLPPIRSQAHAAYPSGHATTSRLIALCICDVVPHAMREALMRMSDRIGENREVAGVHYPSDTAGGKQLANKAHVLLESQCTTFQELRVEAAQEWA